MVYYGRRRFSTYRVRRSVSGRFRRRFNRTWRARR